MQRTFLVRILSTDESVIIKSEIPMPKIVNRQKKKEQILNAAFNVFAKKGFNATKMIDIAREANMGKGTLYEYFKNKKEIFSALFAFLFQDFDREFQQRITAISDPVEKIRLIIQIYFVDVIKRYGDFIKIVMDFWMAEAHRESTAMPASALNLADMYDGYTKLIARIIREGIEQHIFQAVNTEHYAAMLLAIFDGLYLQIFLNVHKFNVNEIADSIFRLFLNSLTNIKQAGDSDENPN